MNHTITIHFAPAGARLELPCSKLQAEALAFSLENNLGELVIKVSAEYTKTVREAAFNLALPEAVEAA
jgi:hypothetical protein